jgi:hypothetical protein
VADVTVGLLSRSGPDLQRALSELSSVRAKVELPHWIQEIDA